MLKSQDKVYKLFFFQKQAEQTSFINTFASYREGIVFYLSGIVTPHCSKAFSTRWYKVRRVWSGNFQAERLHFPIVLCWIPVAYTFSLFAWQMYKKYLDIFIIVPNSFVCLVRILKEIVEKRDRWFFYDEISSKILEI